MSEHIVDTFGIVQDFADLHGDMSAPLYQAITDVLLSRQREEVIRCINCRFLLLNKETFHRCKLLGHEVYDLRKFCAWGERKVPV